MEFLVNQLVYFAFLQSLFLIGIFSFSSKARKHINPYLMVLVGVITVGLSGKVINASELFGRSHAFYGLSEYSTFLFGATVFLFTKSALFPKKFEWKDLIHYLPGVAYIIVITFYFILAPNELVVARVNSGELFRMVVIFMGLGLIVNWTYWIYSFRLFKSFQQDLNGEVSYSVQTQFFYRFLMTIGACLTIWLVVYVIGIVGESWLERTVRQFIWLSLTFIVLFISFYSIKSPELFRVATLIKPRKYAQSKLSNLDLDKLKQQLDLLMDDKKPYLNRNLLKADLAEMLGVNHPEMARLLNERIGMSFFEYINYYRIKEFVLLAQSEEGKKLTFFGLAQEAGFNSKTTFNKSFKKLLGTSPKEYFANGQVPPLAPIATD